MSGAGIVWQRSPAVLADAVERYAERIAQAIETVGDLIALNLESYARANAPWTDRTTQARRGLTGISVAAADMVHVYLFHAAAHGKWLEIARGGPYKIIMPTLQAHYGEIMALIRALLGG